MTSKTLLKRMAKEIREDPETQLFRAWLSDLAEHILSKPNSTFVARTSTIDDVSRVESTFSMYGGLLTCVIRRLEISIEDKMAYFDSQLTCRLPRARTLRQQIKRLKW
jgi:hypothetical protein